MSETAGQIPVKVTLPWWAVRIAFPAAYFLNCIGLCLAANAVMDFGLKFMKAEVA